MDWQAFLEWVPLTLTDGILLGVGALILRVLAEIRASAKDRAENTREIKRHEDEHQLATERFVTSSLTEIIQAQAVEKKELKEEVRDLKREVYNLRRELVELRNVLASRGIAAPAPIAPLDSGPKAV